MSGEVKKIISDIIMQSEDNEITLASIQEMHKDIDKVDIIAVLRELEQENLGVLAVGRRGHPTRFLKGHERVIGNVPPNQLEAFRNKINEMQNNETIEVTEALDLFSNKKTVVIDAMKVLEKEGLGLFLIGRRGSKSRFVKGKSIIRNKIFFPASEKQNPVSQTKQTTSSSVKYNVANNLLFGMSGISGGFDSIEEALQAEGISADADTVKQELSKAGFVNLADYR